MKGYQKIMLAVFVLAVMFAGGGMAFSGMEQQQILAQEEGKAAGESAEVLGGTVPGNEMAVPVPGAALVLRDGETATPPTDATTVPSTDTSTVTPPADTTTPPLDTSTVTPPATTTAVPVPMATTTTTPNFPER